MCCPSPKTSPYNCDIYTIKKDASRISTNLSHIHFHILIKPQRLTLFAQDLGLTNMSIRDIFRQHYVLFWLRHEPMECQCLTVCIADLVFNWPSDSLQGVFK